MNPKKSRVARIDWLKRCHMAEVMEIENLSFESPWTERDFICCLRQRNCIGKIAAFDERVVGFMCYELQKSSIQFLDFAVHTDFRRLSIGRQMAADVTGKLSHHAHQRRNCVMLGVRETNVDAQLFFRAMGFHAVAVLRNTYQDSTDDAYLMQYRLEWPAVIGPRSFLSEETALTDEG